MFDGDKRVAAFVWVKSLLMVEVRLLRKGDGCVGVSEEVFC
jgi:hypothetical protein